jgi:Spy/CpxP family protein refolding chaperone
MNLFICFLLIALASLTVSFAQMSVPSDRKGLEGGEGMGLAMYAEQNGYPGPKHVIEFKEKLGLSPDQLKKTQALMDGTILAAKAKGGEIVEVETELFDAFKTGNINERRVTELTTKIGKLGGELRAVHLKAHIRMKQILNTEQIALYKRLRGHEE